MRSVVVFRLLVDVPVHREDSDEVDGGEIAGQERGERRGTADEVFKKTPRGPVQISLQVQEKAEATDQDLDKQNPRRGPKKSAPFLKQEEREEKTTARPQLLAGIHSLQWKKPLTA